MKAAKQFLFLILCLFLSFSVSTLKAGEKIEIGKEFNLFTEKNLEGFLKPFFTSLEESINSNIFSTARYKDCWTVGLDFSVSGMFIPNSHTVFDAERPGAFGNTNIVRTGEIRDGEVLTNYIDDNIQPTIYGGSSTALFAARQNAWYPDSTNKTVGYVEGNNISFMSGLPAIQLTVNIPSRTQVRFRFLTLNVAGESMVYWGVFAAQKVDEFFNLFKPNDLMGLAVHLGYTNASRNPGISLNTFAIGTHFSKSWDYGLTVYAGAQYETISGKFEAVRDKSNPSNYVDNPYEEIRNLNDISINISSFNKFKLLGGVAYRFGFAELHLDAGIASQPIVSAGIHFLFGEWGESQDLELERQIKREKITK